MTITLEVCAIKHEVNVGSYSFAKFTDSKGWAVCGQGRLEGLELPPVLGPLEESGARGAADQLPTRERVTSLAFGFLSQSFAVVALLICSCLFMLCFLRS